MKYNKDNHEDNMKTVTELYQGTNSSNKAEQLPKTGSELKEWTPNHIKRMTTLWMELLTLYDNQALKKYGQVGSDVFIAWGNKLRYLKNEELRRGLTNCQLDGSEYAPSLKTFIWYCEGKAKGLTHSSAAYKPFDKSRALEHKPDQERVKTELEKMREKLK